MSIRRTTKTSIDPSIMTDDIDVDVGIGTSHIFSLKGNEICGTARVLLRVSRGDREHASFARTTR